MSSIKIIHNNTARRLTVNENTQWNEIAERLSNLFQLHPSASIVLSYIDSDNDTITLSTTTELQEALAQGVTRFNATIGGSDSTSDDWVVPGAETPRTIESAFESLYVAETVHPKVTESTEEATIQASPYQTTIEDTEDLPKYNEEAEKPKLDKGKQKDETGESSRAGSTHSAKEGEGAFSFEGIQEQLQKLCEEFKDVIEQNPQLLETANTLMEQLVQNIPVDIDIFATLLNGADKDDGQRRPFEFAFRPGPPFARGPFGRGPSCHSFRSPHNIGMTGVHPFFAGHPYGGRHGGCGARQKEDGYATFAECLRQFKERAGSDEAIRSRCGAWQEKRRMATARTEQSIKDKIESLNAMGFYETYSDESFEELVGRYDGNIERIVEVLVQRQQNKEATGDQKINGYDI